jgi:hypothetical protein
MKECKICAILFRFSHVLVLAVNNSLTGTLPTEIGLLRSLWWFHLRKSTKCDGTTERICHDQEDCTC